MMPLVRTIIPLEHVRRDPTLQRIVERIDKGTQTYRDIIALARHLKDGLEFEIRSTSTST